MRNVKEVVDKVEALGLGSRSIVEFLERERLDLPAHLRRDDVRGPGWPCSSRRSGIANTMLMSVLERRREDRHHEVRSGAADWQLQALFVIEGA